MMDIEDPIVIDGVLGSDGKIYFSAEGFIADMRREARIHEQLMGIAADEGEIEEAFCHGVACEKLRLLADQYDLLAIQLACDFGDDNG